MNGGPAARTYTPSVWARLAGRVDPYLDPVVGVAAAGLSLASLLITDVDTVDPRLHEPNLLAGVATVAAAGSLAWRRKRPVASYAAFVTGALIVSGSYHYIGLLSVLMLVSLYSLVTHRSHRDGLLGLGVAVAAFVGLWLAGVPDLEAKDLLLALALLVAAWAVGDAVRSRREQHSEQVRSAITQERLRIARELHDVVAHSMSLIAVQAGVGSHVIRTDPDAAQQSLDVIADTSRRALEQTRSMLGMLRDASDDSARPPTQGLDDLPALVKDVVAAGLRVEFVQSEPVPSLDAAVSLTAYRIVQESLTNVIKHSAAKAATVLVTVTDSRIDLEVSDLGPRRMAAASSVSGHGLVGLDERARLVGGSVEYGAVGDGFRVHATLPIGALR